MSDVITCRNCNSSEIKNFCSNCGQKVYKSRFTIKSFIFDLLSAFDMEKGFFHTAKLLFIKPGKVTNDYINGKTKIYFNPLKYLLVIGGIYAFLILGLNIFDTGLESMSTIYGHGTVQNNSEKAAQLQDQWLNFYKQIINFIPLLMIPFISIATKWFYKSKGLFYGEHLIINSYIFAHSFVILILLMPIIILFPATTSFFPLIAFIVIIGYLSYALYSTYNDSPIKSIFGSFFSLIIGYLFFLLMLIFVLCLVILFMIITK